MVSEREIEAAMSGWHRALIDAPDESVYERRRRCIHAALSAAARVRAEDNAEPVVGVSLSDLKEWRSEWIEANDPSDDTDCVTPFDKYLYTCPAPQPSETVEVKPLEWVKHGNDYFADTVVGQYCVGLVHTSFRTVLRCITQGQWADIEVSGNDGLEDARDAAQADYERRILSALTTSKPQPSGWQPIETAPTDGRMILVYEARSAHPIHLRSADGDWWRKQGVGPSHWMPLPTPPTVGGGNE